MFPFQGPKEYRLFDGSASGGGTPTPPVAPVKKPDGAADADYVPYDKFRETWAHQKAAEAEVERLKNEKTEADRKKAEEVAKQKGDYDTLLATQKIEGEKAAAALKTKELALQNQAGRIAKMQIIMKHLSTSKDTPEVIQQKLDLALDAWKYPVKVNADTLDVDMPDAEKEFEKFKKDKSFLFTGTTAPPVPRTHSKPVPGSGDNGVPIDTRLALASAIENELLPKVTNSQ